MKILADSSIDLNAEIAKIHAEERKRLAGTMASGMDMRIQDIFLLLANKFPETTFILLDDEKAIIGWRN